jgi:hypothetical protein
MTGIKFTQNPLTQERPSRSTQTAKQRLPRVRMPSRFRRRARRAVAMDARTPEEIDKQMDQRLAKVGIFFVCFFGILLLL